MKIAKSYNKKTGVTYVYEVLETKWNPEKKRGEPVRRLIGKLDPVTGEIIPTGKRGRPPKTDNSTPSASTRNSDDTRDYQSLYTSALDQLHQKDLQIQQLEHQLQVSERKRTALIHSLSNLLASQKEDLNVSKRPDKDD